MTEPHDIQSAGPEPLEYEGSFHGREVTVKVIVRPVSPRVMYRALRDSGAELKDLGFRAGEEIPTASAVAMYALGEAALVRVESVTNGTGASLTVDGKPATDPELREYFLEWVSGLAVECARVGLERSRLLEDQRGN